MPMKYQEDIVTKDRKTLRLSTQRFYMHTLSTPSLWEEFGRCRTPKIKAKFRNELVKRGFSDQTILSSQSS
jgi:hypothetical protein